MPTCVVLYRFTDQGRRNIKATVGRATEIRRENEVRGFKILGHYWTQGQYDLVAIVQAPSEDAMMGGLFSITEAGNVVSETMHSFDEEDMQGILART